MTAIKRTQHYTDERVDGREHRRTISNYCNYQTPVGLWLPSDPNVEEAAEPPNNWAGKYEFLHTSNRAPLQAFFGDQTDPGSALVGVRLSDRPDYWMNLKAVGTNQADMRTEGQSVTWVDLWDQCDLTFTAARHKLEKIIALKQPGHPNSFTFTVKLAAGHKLNAKENRLVVIDSAGAEWLRLPAAWALDANEKPVRAKITIGETNGFQSITIEPNLEDLEQAVYPIRIDPTTTISGTTLIEDAFIRSEEAGSEARSYGGSPYLCIGKYLGSAGKRRQLWRCGSSAIPAGTITDFRLKALRLSSSLESASGSVLSYFIADANTWIEGTGNDGGGPCCWDYAATSAVPWVGSEGCGTSGTDYDADADPPTQAFSAYTSGADVWFTFTLDTAWATAWRDATRVNNGFIQMVASETTNGSFWFGYSTEIGIPAKQPYFEVDYTTGPDKSALYYYHSRRRS